MLYFPSKTQNLCCEGLLNLIISLEDTVKDLTELALSKQEKELKDLYINVFDLVDKTNQQ